MHWLRPVRGRLQQRDGQSGLPRGLIRYATPSGMASRWSSGQMRRVAPAACAYLRGLVGSAWRCSPAWRCARQLKVDVVSDRAGCWRLVSGGQLENLYRLQIMNATEAPHFTASAPVGWEGAHGGRRTARPRGCRRPAGCRCACTFPTARRRQRARTVYFTVEAQGRVPARVVERAAFQVPR